MSIENAIGALGGFIMTAGMLGLLFRTFRIQDYPKKWKKEIDEMHVPEILRKEDTKSD